MNRKKIGIVVPVLNYFQGLADLMMSIQTKHDYTVLVWPQYLKRLPLAAVWNKAQDLLADGCDYALVCNDDILFSPACIDTLVSEYERLRPEGVIMVTPNNLFNWHGGKYQDKYQILDHVKPADEPVTVSDHPNFSCFLITQEYFDKVGTFDEKFTPAWYEDNDSHRRAELAGLREVCTTAAEIVHLGGTTTTMMENPDSGESQRHYIEKWGGMPKTHNRADLPVETYVTPYNDPNKTIKDW